VTGGVSLLTLGPAVLRRTLLDGSVTRHPESHYLEFVIDGQLLTERLPLARGLITPLNRAWLPMVHGAIEELLGRRPTDGLGPGRVALFVCGECGDLACGAVTATLTVEDDTVTWSDFAWDNGYEPTDPMENAPDPIAFARVDYTDLFAGAEERVAAFPYDELDHQGLKFLWPWQWGWRLPKDNP
jgi:hypothetical protein